MEISKHQNHAKKKWISKLSKLIGHNIIFQLEQGQKCTWSSLVCWGSILVMTVSKMGCLEIWHNLRQVLDWLIVGLLVLGSLVKSLEVHAIFMVQSSARSKIWLNCFRPLLKQNISILFVSVLHKPLTSFICLMFYFDRSTFAVDGTNMKVNVDVERVLKEFHTSKKPIGWVGAESGKQNDCCSSSWLFHTINTHTQSLVWGSYCENIVHEDWPYFVILSNIL